MLVDTDILIWLFKGNIKAKRAIDKLDRFSISAINYIELLQGVRNKAEMRQIRRFIVNKNIHIISINPEITSRSICFIEEFALSHGLRLADALIAASAEYLGESLFTGNVSHYKMIPNISLRKFSPK